MKGIYWLFYLLFVLGFGGISCSGDAVEYDIGY